MCERECAGITTRILLRAEQGAFVAEERIIGKKFSGRVLGASLLQMTTRLAIMKRSLETYLLIGWGRLDNVIHQGRNDFCYSEYTGSERAILGSARNFLVILLSLLDPFPYDRVDQVEDAQFVGARSFLEMRIEFLDNKGFILQEMLMLATVMPSLRVPK